MGILVRKLFGCSGSFTVEDFSRITASWSVAMYSRWGEKRSLIFLFCRTKVITWGAKNSQKKKDANALENILHLELGLTCNKIAFIFW